MMSTHVQLTINKVLCNHIFKKNAWLVTLINVFNQDHFLPYLSVGSMQEIFFDIT